MNELRKSCLVEKAVEVNESELALINRQSLRKLSAEEVFAFRLVACDTKVDRDYEHFTHEALGKMAQMYVGRPLLRDHNWSADAQTGRIYAASIEPKGAEEQLVLRAYMVRNEATAPIIQAIEGGILREASVGCVCKTATCSICGTDKVAKWCEHTPGKAYGGKTCVVALDGVADCYEVSLVAVPAQRAAGVTKTYGGEDNKPQPPTPEDDPEVQKALALVALEEKRF